MSQKHLTVEQALELARAVDDMAERVAFLRSSEFLSAEWLGGDSWRDLGPDACVAHEALNRLQCDLKVAGREISDLLLSMMIRERRASSAQD